MARAIVRYSFNQTSRRRHRAGGRGPTARARHPRARLAGPGISLAAQAFLFTFIFDSDRDLLIRGAIAAVGLVVSLATIQLLLKHRHAEEVYAEAIDLTRRVKGLEPLKGLQVLQTLTAEFGSEPHRRRRQNRVREFFVRAGAVEVWLWTLAAFGAFEAPTSSWLSSS